jgi:Uma2 family endonuclease
MRKADMATVTAPQSVGQGLPDHTQLPESDGTFVHNFQEHPQSMLLTDSLRPVLQQQHPQGDYCIGQDSGIYWRLTQPPEPPERGATAPDWFYVPNVPATLGGQMRRSYVVWQEWVAPLIVLEFVSGDGSEKRDRTPVTGKFWIYEQAIRTPFYGIYEVNPGRVEVYHLMEGRYQPVPPTRAATTRSRRWASSWASGKDAITMWTCRGYAGGTCRVICCSRARNAPRSSSKGRSA